jgi:hypothetical protein
MSTYASSAPVKSARSIRSVIGARERLVAQMGYVSFDHGAVDVPQAAAGGGAVPGPSDFDVLASGEDVADPEVVGVDAD